MEYTIVSRPLAVKLLVPPSRGSSKEDPTVTDVRRHPCKLIACFEIDAVGNRPPTFGLAESMSNGVIGVGNSMMGFSSSDDEEK